jgi:hypothetical protein
MEEIQIKLTKEFIAKVEDDEIDFDLQREFAGEVDGDTYIDIEWIEKGAPMFGSEGYPIRIDRVLQILQEMKDKGATHVEMEYHCDHISYPIYGYRITHADQTDIDELERKRTQAEKLEAEAKELRAKLREIEDQRRSLT